MATSHAYVSKNRRNLEKEIKNKKRDLETYIKHISPTHYESISLLSEKINKKKEEIKGCWWFQCK